MYTRLARSEDLELFTRTLSDRDTLGPFRHVTSPVQYSGSDPEPEDPSCRSLPDGIPSGRDSTPTKRSQGTRGSTREEGTWGEKVWGPE